MRRYEKEDGERVGRETGGIVGSLYSFCYFLILISFCSLFFSFLFVFFYLWSSPLFVFLFLLLFGRWQRSNV